jgi:hypothetical protein
VNTKIQAHVVFDSQYTDSSCYVNSVDFGVERQHSFEQNLITNEIYKLSSDLKKIGLLLVEGKGIYDIRRRKEKCCK